MCSKQHTATPPSRRRFSPKSKNSFKNQRLGRRRTAASPNSSQRKLRDSCNTRGECLAALFRVRSCLGLDAIFAFHFRIALIWRDGDGRILENVLVFWTGRDAA